MRHAIAAALGALVLSACATTSGYEAVLQTWIGDTSDHLVSAWGPPQSEYPLSNGGKVLVYTRSRSAVIPGVTTFQPVTTTESGSVSANTTSVYSPSGVQTQGTYSGTSTTYVPHTSPSTTLHFDSQTRFTTDSTGRITNSAWQGNNSIAKAPPPRPTATAPSPPPEYKKCTADQIRSGECN